MVDIEFSMITILKDLNISKAYAAGHVQNLLHNLRIQLKEFIDKQEKPINKFLTVEIKCIIERLDLNNLTIKQVSG